MLNVIKIAIFSAYFCLALSSATSESMAPEIAPKYPNIVLFLADDMSWFDVGAYHQRSDYAPKNARTPHIDQLAREGMMFSHAFTTTAMCAVTRQQLYTGLYPVRSGAFGNHTRVHNGVKSVAHYFRDMGYRVGLAGKGHVFPGKAYPFIRAGKANKGATGESSFGIEITRQFMARDKTRPFFLIVASANPHEPWSRGDATQYPPNALQVPPFLNDTQSLRERLSAYLAEVSDLDREVGLVDDELKKLGLHNDTIFIFTTEQGSSLPFGKWTTYDSGLKTAFIVRWPRKITADTVSDAMIEYVDVIPTLTDIVNNTVPANTDGSSFKSVLLGEQTEHKVYVYGIQTSLNVHYGAAYPIRSIRSKRLKLIHNLMADGNFSNILTQDPWFKEELAAEKKLGNDRYARYVTRPEYELYDVINDPFEQINLIDQPDYKMSVKSLKRYLENWMVEQGDRGIDTELSVCERKGFAHRRCP